MPKFYLVLITIGLFSQTNVAESKTQIITPGNNTWLRPIDDPVDLDIKGTSTLSKGTDVMLTIDQKSWMSKLEDKGAFRFSIDQTSISPLSKTRVVVHALNESDSIDVFCCSTDELGFFERLEPNKKYDFTFRNSKSEIDGVKVLISKTAIKNSVNLVVVVDRSEMINLPEEGYIPLSGPVSIEYTGYVDNSKITYAIPMQLNIPRDNLAGKTTPLGWSSSHIGRWKDVDPTEHKIVVLAQTFKNSQQVWSEIIPSKISKDSVEFKVPKDIRSNLFVVAAKK